MRLTLHTDYALRCLLYLGVHTDRLVSIREIATAYRISENHLVKITHRLGIGGFIQTVRGRSGGLRLARSAADIRVGDVVRFTEEDMALVTCMQAVTSPDQVCLLADACQLRGTLNKAMTAFMTVLDDYTIRDMITPFERTRLGGSPAPQPNHRQIRTNGKDQSA